MSLVGVFRCGDSAVLIADTQETRGFNKTEVQKLQVVYGPELGYLAFAAASNAPELSDRLWERISSIVRKPLSSSDAVRSEMARRVAEFYDTDEYKNFPAERPEDKRTEAIACVVNPGQWPRRPVDVFHFSETTVRRVVDFELFGSDYFHARRIARRRWKASMTVPEATLLGLYLFRSVEQTSTSVGRPFDVAIATPDGIHRQEQDLTELHLKHVTTIVDTLEEVIFAAPNLEEPDDAMAARWGLTCNSMTALRDSFRSDVSDYARRQREALMKERPINLKLPEE